ncbi:MAG: tRNA (adenosine(37)-N6)-dimethylallyltransferase MiaA [Acidimicrobiales bacterium]|nr:tRNA (adenosine(37)-N6)-dimethylallyltransferase MiaA [Acidimicrobiales bacterium]MDP6286087.1 tRNA (adenosine(37)-N6)-dimethylallyltransferase MiaA [Acidimicrobiales bacterium]HJL91357.1 tRNA (adenosine(37)-N6)-dimethylallyltransferase MiaA [Acidimicrobiales bacterium]
MVEKNVMPSLNGNLLIVGTTASGKSSLAIELARHRSNVEIISIDSMAIYRGMNIGTATPTIAEQEEIPHHVINIVDPSDEFALPLFQLAVKKALKEITDRGNRAVLVGGTGLHVRSVVDRLEIPPRFLSIRDEIELVSETSFLYRKLNDLDPTAAAKIEPGNRRRIVRALEVTLGTGRPFSSFGPGLDVYPPSPFTQIGIRLPRDLNDLRIVDRYKKQIDDGFVEEVRNLVSDGRKLSKTASQALGYKQIISYIEGDNTLDEAIESAVSSTRRFARRQEKWFRRDPRIQWLDVKKDPLELLEEVIKVFDAIGRNTFNEVVKVPDYL